MTAPYSDSGDARVRREAADWLARHDRGLTAGEQDDFFQWLAADPRHGTWFTRHRAGWNRLDAIADWRPEHGVEPNPDVLARPALRPRWLRPVRLAAIAAGFALTAGIWWLAKPASSPLVARADAGGYERRVLDDGSVAELNHGAEIEVNYSAGERRVVLRRGEALFTVEKNPSRPFVVLARGVAVRAVGTAFSVRLDPAAVEVLVTEGKVQVAPPSAGANSPAPVPSPLIVAGERATVPLTAQAVPQVARSTPADLARLQAWQPQLLDFSSVPLAQVIAELNRRNRVQLILADPASGRVPIVASIRSDNVAGFVSLVAAPAGLRAEPRGDYEIVLRPVR